MSAPIPALAERADAAAARLADAEHVLLVSHADADGVTSAAIGAAALERAGVGHDVAFEDQLDEAAIEGIADRVTDVVLLTDFGSGQLDELYAYLDPEATVIADHHQPLAAEAAPPSAPTAEGYADAPHHVNPLLVGLDGARECSGAGAVYAVARALGERTRGADGRASESDGRAIGSGGRTRETDGRASGSDSRASGSAPSPRAAFDDEPLPPLTGAHAIHPGSEPDPLNRDLAALAIVGAVGDRQREDGELVGANVAIAEEGEAAGALELETDLAVYGTQTKPLPRLLAHADELRIPGTTTDRDAAARFLDGLDVACRAEGEWQTWAELTAPERRTVASALLQRAIQRGVPAERIDEMVGTAYTLAGEEPATQLRDASEFATLLNATARYERSSVGLAVCLGDREGALSEAIDLLAEHRRNLSRGVRWVERNGVTAEANCQWFDAGSEIPATIVGIVAGMAVGVDGVDPTVPIVAFAEDDGEVKVSARATGGLVRRGVDLSAAMATAAAAVDGSGGGHTVAAGATIPQGTTEAFVATVDDVLGEQLGD